MNTLPSMTYTLAFYPVSYNRAPPLNPPVNSNNIYRIYIDKDTNCSLVGTFHFVS